MTTARCAYCGDLAENPVQLTWAITDEADDDTVALSGSLPLCLACSRSWYPQTDARPAVLSSQERNNP